MKGYWIGIKDVLHRRRVVIAALLVIAVTAATYLPALNNGFTNWDDDLYLTSNPGVQDQSWGAARRIATTFLLGNYHPLRVFSYALEYRVFGLNPRASHAINLGLHLINTLLALRLLSLLGLPLSAALAAALLFGVHPVHADAVAWVSGRKDLLCALFAFGSLLSYVSYLHRGRNRWRLLLSLCCFFLALLSKATALGLPLILIGLDALLGRKIDKPALLEKLPFAGLSLVFGAIAVIARSGYQEALQEPSRSLFAHLFIQVHRLVYYFTARTVAPVGDRWLYPETFLSPRFLSPSLWIALGLLAAAAGGLFLVRKHRDLLFGAAFFLITLAPVLTVTILGPTADRFLYLPLFGACLLAGTAIARGEVIAKNAGSRPGILAGLLALALVAVYAPLTWQRLPAWRDSFTLWTRALEHFPESATPHIRRGEAFLAAGETDRALADFDQALKKDPGSGEVWFQRGTARLDRGDLAGAFADFSRAIEIKPDSAQAYLSRGNLYFLQGLPAEAEADFTAAIRRSPDSAAAHYNRGNLYLNTERYRQAVDDLDRALAIDRRFARAWNSRGVARVRLGDPERAVLDFTRALEIDPGYAGAFANRARAFLVLGRKEQARKDVEMIGKLGKPVSPDLLDAVASPGER